MKNNKSFTVSVKKIKKWTKTNAKPLYVQIAGPATESELDKVLKLASKYDISLLPSYLAFLKIMNGQKNDMAGDAVGLIPANDSSYVLYGTKRIINDLRTGIDSSTYKRRFDCSDEIQQTYFDKSWVRFATDWDAALAIDLNPTAKGKIGQVIFISYTSPIRRVICSSFEDFLTKLANGYETDKYEFTDGEMRKRRKNAFPNLEFKTSPKSKVKKDTPTKEEVKARIEIKGRVLVFTESKLGTRIETAQKVLKKLDGKFSFESVVPFFNSNKHEIAVQKKLVEGGKIQLEYDKETKLLWVITRYQAKAKLTAKELNLLKEHTMGQWSDGLGSSFADEVCNEFGFNVDLFPVLDDYDPFKPVVSQEA